MSSPPDKQIRVALRALADASIAAQSRRFFKTAEGEYGAGDQFLGIRVPELRRIAREFRDASLREVGGFLRSRWHEERLFAVILLTEQYARGDAARQEAIHRLYCDNLRFINNWDIVDASAPRIVGPHLEKRDRSQLHIWAKSSDLWERRIAIMATFHFIRGNDFADTLTLAEMLLHDPEDLIHKAVGWMLREIGNRDRAVEEAFLERHAAVMPRTMLRYAVEKFPERKRRAWLARR